MHDTLPLLGPTTFPALTRKTLATLQVNIGLRCNLACLHCHTNSSPYRREAMDDATLELLLEVLASTGVPVLDITGGAPELHPRFRELVTRARAMDRHVIDRCNLTVLLEDGQADLHEFLAGQGVEVIASLPCHGRGNVDAQRGKGVFDASITALGRLNAVGYGMPGTGLDLHLVHNPVGPFLPPPQAELEAQYRQRLEGDFGILFNRLLTLANMPINRFGSTLVSQGRLHEYLALLRNAHRDENLEHVMCRSLVSVDWRGNLHDCDFNQMLGIGITPAGGRPLHLRDLLRRKLEDVPIAVRNHCYGCSAGQGSSCGGALSS